LSTVGLIFLLPVGAYQPNWFMKYQHVHPGEAVEIHKDIKSKK
jgi:N-acyl-phosphatidylethanolamine-hydrolysing phospholipase D